MSFTLILASSSPYRKAQLGQLLGEHFRCEAPDINESPLDGESAEALATRLSREKARAVANRPLSVNPQQSRLIIAGDQSASCQGRLLQKPGSEELAKEQLAFCSQKEVTFYSGLCLFSPEKNWLHVDCTLTSVRFRKLNKAEIAAYVQREYVLDCAGSFKCEGLGISLFESITSTDPSALIGLPLISLNRLLIEAGFNPLLENAT